MTAEKIAALDSFSPETRAAALSTRSPPGPFPSPARTSTCTAIRSFRTTPTAGRPHAWRTNAARAACALQHCATTCSTALRSFSPPAACWRYVPPAVRQDPAPTFRNWRPAISKVAGRTGRDLHHGLRLRPRTGSRYAASHNATAASARRRRNLALIARVNAALPAIAIDYARRAAAPKVSLPSATSCVPTVSKRRRRTPTP